MRLAMLDVANIVMPPFFAPVSAIQSGHKNIATERYRRNGTVQKRFRNANNIQRICIRELIFQFCFVFNKTTKINVH